MIGGLLFGPKGKVAAFYVDKEKVPNPETRNPEPETRNPKQEPRNPKPET